MAEEEIEEVEEVVSEEEAEIEEVEEVAVDSEIWVLQTKLSQSEHLCTHLKNLLLLRIIYLKKFLFLTEESI